MAKIVSLLLLGLFGLFGFAFNGNAGSGIMKNLPAPASLTATVVDATHVKLEWPSEKKAKGYRIYRFRVGVSTSEAQWDVPKGTATMTDNHAFAAGVTYQYGIKTLKKKKESLAMTMSNEVVPIPFSGIEVPYIAYPQVVADGNIGASEWNGAWSSDETFFDGSGGSPITCGVRLMHDGSFLYVAVSTPLSAGWDSKVRLRIDGDNSGTVNGNMTSPYRDIQTEKGSPGSCSHVYDNYRALLGGNQSPRVQPGSGEARGSSGTTNVSYEFKVPLGDLGAVSGSKIRLLITASPDGHSMWYWPVVDLGPGGPESPALWTELMLSNN